MPIGCARCFNKRFLLEMGPCYVGEEGTQNDRAATGRE